MPPNPADPFPTVKLNVPYLKELLEKLRDPAQQRLIVIFHANSPEEGQWVLANAMSRLERSHHSAVCDESMRPTEIIEQALRTKSAIALVGEVRRVDDAHAMRTAAQMGLHIAGYIATSDPAQYQDAITGLGPWTHSNLVSMANRSK
ncbi:MAG TPA: hypothetical protein VNF68_04970 [Candidatus Baltobacteraceae bacterium]|nr:hypothetical protein [Candidatus Baltobacteraceae bacterium]